jgi:hypothetical protein
MDQHDGRTLCRTFGIARPEFDDMEPRAGNLDHPARGRVSALQDHHAGLGDQRQNHQRRDAAD